MIKAIIFDFDGVILDTEIDRFLELKEEVKKHGHYLKYSDLSILFGKKTNKFLKEKFPKMKKESINEISKQRKLSIMSKAVSLSLMPNIKDLIKFLSKNYVLAITTGSQYLTVQKVLKKHNLLKYFKVIVSGDDFKSSKPNPECYKITLRKLNLRNNEVLIIEDSLVGISAAKKLKCKVLALQNAYNKSQIKNADRIFKSHWDILKYFKELKTPDSSKII